MLEQFGVGTLLILYSLAVHAVHIVLAARTLDVLGWWFCRSPHSVKLVIAFVLLGLWLLISMLNSSLAWAAYFHVSGTLETFELAVYFALVSYTTLGFGDVILDPDARILSGLLAANGLIIFGLTTAIIIEFVHTLYRTQNRQRSAFPPPGLGPTGSGDQTGLASPAKKSRSILGRGWFSMAASKALRRL